MHVPAPRSSTRSPVLTGRLSDGAASRAGTLAIGLLAVGVAGIGTAYAAWAVTGTGSVTGTAAEIQPLTVTSTLTGPVYPGSTSGLSLTIANPNVFPVSVTGVSFGAPTSSNPAACPGSNLVVVPPATLAVAVAPGGSTTSALPGLATLSPLAPTGCAGVSFSVPVTVTGVSS